MKRELSEDERCERLGSAIFSVTYLLRALKMIGSATLIFGVIFHFTGVKLWFAPIAGVAVWLIYRGIIRLIFRSVSKLSD